ncbi:GAF domain-containing sensor histidine kinase [Bacillus carboniphilus]|uniref:histidine kinase n=1 Tax=Bacillus carboniphilus TaxID=86663 RepID=A0ABY9JVD0_9BACI|nr:GAF domain-containing sensor histidine kinase [Bacillus carboniphilus]WLR42749.1 GAF domain-containing sensor histidine kinase [Bacillus carboniphilus]
MEKDEKRVEELLMLKTIAETLNMGNDLESMLDEVMKKLLQVTGLTTGWIFLINDKGNYELKAEQSLPEGLCYENKKPMCEGDCWCLERYRDGRLNRATNIINCKRIDDAIEYGWGDTENFTHHATVPLKAGDESVGLLNIGSPFKTHFTEEELFLLENVAFQIGAAIKRVQLSENEQKLALLAERNRLAQDLHDSVNQLLFSLSLTARTTKELTSEPRVLDMLSMMQELSQEALMEMKALIWQLRPNGLEKGIGYALTRYCDVIGLKLFKQIQGVGRLPHEVEETLWRIGQEALNNCKKHAQIDEVELSIKKKLNQVDMMIKDQGIGFMYDSAPNLPSVGLASMKERAEKLSGTFQLESQNNRGTTITVSIPIR